MTDPNRAPDDETPESEAPADTPAPTADDALPEDFHGTRTQVIETGSFEMPSADDGADDGGDAEADAGGVDATGAAAVTASDADDFDAELDEEPDAGGASELPEGRAHECLEIRTPLEEFETYVRARIDTLNRLGERERAEVTVAALELGKRRLARITGVPTK